ncbi:MAG: Gfo/Idh/MocA family oxidoreductase, partial [Candidatus Woesearchaeota archaeon]
MKTRPKDKDLKNILLIGFGPHAKRIYFPLIQKFSKEKRFRIVLGVDLQSKKEDIERYLKEKGASVDLLLISPEEQTHDKIHPKIETELDNAVKERSIDGVIIATEPLVHMMYARWALNRGLSILMDKPISTYENISTDMDRAKQLIADFEELETSYLRAKKKRPRITFSLMSQRRFHPAFQKMKQTIKECFEKTNCPITSIQTFHCDGQWRMPTEIVQQLYHPYMQGYGKCSHSGYHFFDIVPFLLEAGLSKEKHYDNVDLYTNFVRPLDFMEQISLKDYEKLFGKKNFQQNNMYNQHQLDTLM